MFYHDDESFYSFIFRRVITFDRSYSYCVLGSNGFWIENPSIPKDIRAIFACESDEKLISMLRSSGLVSGVNDPFDNPTRSLLFLTNTFNSKLDEPVGNQGTRQIAFCQKCIEDMLLNFGCGYFKSRWLFDDECSIHHEKLVLVPQLRRKDTLNIVLSILKGKYGGDFNINHRLPLKRRKSYIDPQNEILSRKIYPLPDENYHVMPCLKLSFLYLMSGIRNNFVAFPYNNLSYQSMTLIIHCVDQFRIKRDINDYILSHLFLQLQNDGVEIINDFFIKVSEVCKFKFGFMKSNSFQISVMKRKYSNCSKCYEAIELIQCPKNLIIARFDV